MSVVKELSDEMTKCLNFTSLVTMGISVARMLMVPGVVDVSCQLPDDSLVRLPTVDNCCQKCNQCLLRQWGAAKSYSTCSSL